MSDTTRRLPVVGVMGSGQDAEATRAARLGEWLANADVHLLTGGGGGVMRAVSAAFCARTPRRGICIGVLPADARGVPAPPSGYPNPFVELSIRTHLHERGSNGVLPLSRNHINVLSSDVVVILAGGAGTLSEVQLALDYQRPVFAHLAERDELPGLPAEVPNEPDFERLRSRLDFAIEAARRAMAAGRESSALEPAPNPPSLGTRIARGDLFWLQPMRGPSEVESPAHPHVVVQDDLFNQSRVATVIVCALTSNLHRANEPGNVLLDEGEAGLPARSVVVVSQIDAVDKARLTARIGSLSDARVEQILAGLRFQQRSFFER